MVHLCIYIINNNEHERLKSYAQTKMNATSFKISVKNGTNLISFEVKNVTVEGNEALEFLASEVLCELENLHNTNQKLKNLGYKGNFFSFSSGRKCILAIEAKTETENFEFLKTFEFSFNKLLHLTDPEEGLSTILKANRLRANNNTVFNKI